MKNLLINQRNVCQTLAGCKRPVMNKPVWGIVAAAGKARRFGRDKLARRLEGGDTVLVQSCKRLLEGGVEHLVIVGDPAVEHGLEQLEEAFLRSSPEAQSVATASVQGLRPSPMRSSGWQFTMRRAPS